MTSGLLILSKNYDSSLKLSTEIADRTVSKYYICHTEGYFPNTLINESDLLINFEAEDGVIKCDKPMGPLCARMGIHTIISEAEGGKSAQTHFTRLVYDPKSDTSLVLCRLFTGRTHQIRLHLQYLGFPIVDDPVYNTLDWGKNKGKGAQYELTREEIVNNFDQTRTPSTYEKGGPSSPKHLVVDSDSIPENCFPHPKVVTRLENSKDSECSWCSKEYYDPIMKNLILRLHAYRYCASDWSYTAPLPDWAIFIQSENLDNLIEEAIKKL